MSIWTHPRASLTQLDVDAFNAQYPQLSVEHTTAFHDRFLVLDKEEGYFVGASLKDTVYDGREMVAWLKDRCACVFVDGEAACRPFGSARYLNIVLLGAALGTGRLELTEELIRNQIRRYVPARFLETNLKAFEAGLSLKS